VDKSIQRLLEKRRRFFYDEGHMKETLVLESPAKINLRLEILRKREDGYHELKTIFQKISLHDTLHFFLKKGKGISITTDHRGLPVGKTNLIYRAAQSILKRSNYRGGVTVEIEKRIPLGAGLGGGSSNAATTLKGLNQLLEMNLSRKELMELGLEIGADVPFFFLKGAALGSGIGERLKKIELPHLWYVLIYPNFEVSTRWAYENFDKLLSTSTLSKLQKSKGLTNQRFHINLGKFLKTLKGVSQILFNHLEAVVSKEYPQIDVMKKMLFSAGGMGALMTGSGPTVFGLFPGERIATKAYEKIEGLASRRGWAIFKAHSIAE
jgi:4-diphosphocytidyl-2-C-methyl-D-erythritol kinase